MTDGVQLVYVVSLPPPSALDFDLSFLDNPVPPPPPFPLLPHPNPLSTSLPSKHWVSPWGVSPSNVNPVGATTSSRLVGTTHCPSPDHCQQRRSTVSFLPSIPSMQHAVLSYRSVSTSPHRGLAVKRQTPRRCVAFLSLLCVFDTNQPTHTYLPATLFGRLGMTSHAFGLPLPNTHTYQLHSSPRSTIPFVFLLKCFPFSWLHAPHSLPRRLSVRKQQTSRSYEQAYPTTPSSHLNREVSWARASSARYSSHGRMVRR